MKPFLLTPVLVERPWGGRRLGRYGKPVPKDALIGESWEVADLPDGVAGGVPDPRSRVSTGPDEGATLAQMITRHGAALMGSVSPTPGGEFPLLVKLLDASQNLSVQVHPHADYARAHPEVRVKTESWYVMEAEPEAELFLDVAKGVTQADVEGALGTSSVVEMLRRVPARSGDFHHLPAGLVHALGAGVMVAEVQTPSDTTFRIYDWTDEYGRPRRPLHLTEASETILIKPPDYLFRPSNSQGVGVRRLIDTDHYWIVEHRTDSRLEVGDGSGARICLVVKGSAEFLGLSAPAGTTVMVPAAAGQVEAGATEGSIVLEVGLPGA